MASTSCRRPSPVFAALGDPTRVALLERLRAPGGRNLSALAVGTGMSRQAVSKHLGVLTHAGLVRASSRGRDTVYELDAAPLAEAAAWLDEFRALWDARLDRLDTFLHQLAPEETP